MLKISLYDPSCPQLGRLNEVVTDCSEALKLDENYLKALFRRAKCYIDLEQFEEAVQDYERINKIDKSRGTFTSDIFLCALGILQIVFGGILFYFDVILFNLLHLYVDLNLYITVLLGLKLYDLTRLSLVFFY